MPLGGVTPRTRRLAGAFGLGPPTGMTRVARGAMGAVWRLDTTGGPVALKELFWGNPGEAHAVRELAFTQACRDAGIPSPLAVPSTSGPVIVSEPDGSSWRVYDWVDGEHADWQDVPVTVWLAQQAATIHRLDWRPVPGEPLRVDYDQAWYERAPVDWPELVGRAVLAHVPGADRLADRLEVFVRTTAFVNQVPSGPLLWCHRDLNPTNVVLAGGDRYLVDWDNAGPIDPVRDLAMVVMHVLRDDDAVATIHQAYVDAGGPVRLHTAESLASAAVIHLGFLAEQVELLVGADTDEDHRSFALEAVRLVTESIPTVEELAGAAGAMGGPG